MRLMYPLFYRQFGLRRVSQLMTPALPMMDRLDLPKNSIYHYAGDGLLDDGPRSDDFLVRNITRPIFMYHVTHIADQKGNPRRLTIPVDPLIRSYHVKNRKFRKLMDLKQIPKDPMSLIIMNYSYIPRLYRYMRSVYSEYYRWNNQQAAIWKNVNDITEFSDRNQFMLLKLPKRLPSISELKLASMTMNQRSVKTFNTAESLGILELWKWLGENRKSSLLNMINKENYDKVNFIFIESGRFLVFNLGVLNSWRSASIAELKEDVNANKKGFSPEQIQKRFLRLLIAIFDLRSKDVPENLEEGIVDSDGTETTSSGDTNQSSIITKITEYEDVDSKPRIILTLDEEQERIDASIDGNDTALDIEDDFEQDLLIDKELEELERIAALSISIAKEKEYDLYKGDDVDDDDDDDDDDDSYSQPEEVKELVTELHDTIGKESNVLEKSLMRVADRYAENGLISAAEYKRYQDLAVSYKTIIAPDGTTTLDKFIDIKPEQLVIPDNVNMVDSDTVFDKSMLKSSLLVFDEYYIKNILQKDIASMVMNIQKAGIAVTDYQVERVNNILGSYDEYSVKLNPIEGSTSTLRFKLPVINDDGVWRANGSSYNSRAQRGDLPIRKINERRVALTSYYSKIFIERSTKKVNDYGRWLRDHINSINMNNDDSSIVDLFHANEFDNTFMCPRLYSTLGMEFKSFDLTPKKYPDTVGKVTYNVNLVHSKRAELYGEEAINTYETDGSIILGKSKTGYLVLDKENALYHGVKDNLIALGTIETILDLDSSKAPVEYAEIKILGRMIPIGMVLGYEMGLDRLIKFLRIDVRRVPVGTRVNLMPDEYALVFNDETLVFAKDNTFASLILAGFNSFHRTIREYNVHDFNKRGVYLNVLESLGISHRYLREIDTLYQLFVDPITRDLLIEMKEPTTFRGLILRACELLQYDQHPDELDSAYMRTKGYERMAGAVYTEITKAIRAHAGRPGKSKLPIDLNPYQIWTAVSTDSAKVQISEINPIENLQQQESLTYTGTGGRTSQSMVKHTRAFHNNDLGVISEATVDSSDVGINTYMSANPNLKTVRGISRRYNKNKDGFTSLVSTSALLAPCVTSDDLRRVSFISTQNKHVVDCTGYHQMQVRTGYEQVMAHRTSDLFAYTARQKGKVLSVSKEGIVIQYEDGESKGFELGRRFGHAAGLIIPHQVISELKVGDTFEVGDTICYNPGFFERDMLNPKQIAFKAGMLVNTVLMENPMTLEDSCAISKELSSKLDAGVSKIRSIVLDFSQNVHALVQVGQVVESDDILCIIEDQIGGVSTLLDDASLDTLRNLSAVTPLSKMKGTVERIEVYYHGDKEDMSDSLRALCTVSDKTLSRRFKASGKMVFSGSVDDGFRIDGEPLMLDKLVIQVYISTRSAAFSGDKAVFANQLKTVIGEVMDNEMRTESGKVIDAVFGKLSVDNRIVGSVDLMGTTNTLLDVLADRAVKAYNN